MLVGTPLLLVLLVYEEYYLILKVNSVMMVGEALFASYLHMRFMKKVMPQFKNVDIDLLWCFFALFF
jgi:hypothetical protein